MNTNRLLGCIKCGEFVHSGISYSQKKKKFNVLRQMHGDFNMAFNTTCNASELILVLNVVPIRHSRRSFSAVHWLGLSERPFEVSES